MTKHPLEKHSALKQVVVNNGINAKYNRGFTLIEVLIAIVIMGVAISMLSVSISESVRNQEKMQNLLGLYEVALTGQEFVAQKIESQELSGSQDIGDVTLTWEAKLMEDQSAASVLSIERAQYVPSEFNVYFYDVSVLVETAYARKSYQFQQMVEIHKSIRQPRSSFR